MRKPNKKDLKEMAKLFLIFSFPSVLGELYGLYQNPLTYIGSAIGVYVGIFLFYRWAEWKNVD